MDLQNPKNADGTPNIISTILTLHTDQRKKRFYEWIDKQDFQKGN
jgi:hypothetical protein